MPMVELIREDLFDTKELFFDTFTLFFFQDPNPNKRLSNLYTSGMLPDGKEFYIGQIRVDIIQARTEEQGGLREDVWQVFRRRLFERGFFRFLINDKYYLRIPLKEVAYGIDVSVPIWQVSIRNIIKELQDYIEEEKTLRTGFWEIFATARGQRRRQRIAYFESIVKRLQRESPLYIDDKCCFRAEISWNPFPQVLCEDKKSIVFRPEVLVSVFLSPVLARPVF